MSVYLFSDVYGTWRLIIMTNVLSFDLKLIKRNTQFSLYTPIYLEVNFEKELRGEIKVVRSYWLSLAFCMFGHLSLG